MGEIRVENLSFRYPKADKWAIKNINLEIKKGEFLLLCGKSGCGKSTLLRHFHKTLTPYGVREGEVFFGDKPLDEMSQRESVEKTGYIYQDPEAQIVTDKVWHEMAFGLENLGYENKIIKRKVGEIANYFGIQNWFHKDTTSLSGGEKQLLNLASTIVMNPQVLILDEPNSQLDPIKAEEFIETVKKLNQEFGITVIVSEHRLENLIGIVDKVAVMEDGKIIAIDQPERIFYRLIDEDKGLNTIVKGFPAIMRIFGEIQGERLLKDSQNIGDISYKASMPITIPQGKKYLEKLGVKAVDNEKIVEEETKKIKKELFKKIKEQEENIICKVKNVWFKYKREDDYIIKGLNMDIKKGEIYSLVGSNGVGKTTFLNLMTKRIKPVSGSVNWISKDKKKGEFWEIAAVPQNPQSIFTEITVEEEMFQGTKLTEKKVEEGVLLMEEMLEKMELSHLRKRNPYDLSGGEQQRLAIGKILLTRPEIILIDEPTKGLDAFFKEKLEKLIKNLKKEGKTVIMVSHDIEFCANLGGYCGMLFDGEIVGQDESKEFFKGNSFYTTWTNKLFRGIDNDVVTSKEAIEWIKNMSLPSMK